MRTTPQNTGTDSETWHEVTVHFATLDGPALMARAGPIRRWMFRAISELSGSSVRHVAIGDEFAILNVAFGGDRWWPVPAWERQFGAGLIASITVPLDPPVDLIAVRLRRSPLRIATTYLRHRTRGLTPAHNCVEVAAGILRAGGWDVPRRLWTPIQLLRWLDGQPSLDRACAAGSPRCGNPAPDGPG